MVFFRLQALGQLQAAASEIVVASTSDSTVDWFPLLRPASPASRGVGNLIYAWRFS
jgi:hypothetical protein